MIRNNYSQEYMEWLHKNAPSHPFDWIYNNTLVKWHYVVSRCNLRKLLSRHKIRPIDFNPNHATYQSKYPVGYERPARDDGMIMVKTENGWDYKQRVIWEKHFGPVPDNHFIIFLDGNRSNYDIDNLACVTRRDASLMANYKLFTKDKDITETGLSVVKLINSTNNKQGIGPKKGHHKKLGRGIQHG